LACAAPDLARAARACPAGANLGACAWQREIPRWGPMLKTRGGRAPCPPREKEHRVLNNEGRTGRAPMLGSDRCTRQPEPVSIDSLRLRKSLTSRIAPSCWLGLSMSVSELISSCCQRPRVTEAVILHPKASVAGDAPVRADTLGRESEREQLCFGASASWTKKGSPTEPRGCVGVALERWRYVRDPL